MKKIIVTTTINPPQKAILDFCRRKDWEFIIAGDLSTPHHLYRALEKKNKNVKYLHPEEQEKKYQELSDAIGWKSIQRRNIGFAEAYNLGADIIATIDDDNIPYDFWGKDLQVNKEVLIDLYEPQCGVFDPLAITKSSFVWHRGFPIDLLQKRLKVKYRGKVKRKILVQADLWDGDPDIDALARLTFMPLVKFPEIKSAYGSNSISPFNSQNTFLSRKVIPYYAVLPHIGRMDDIWGGYILQHYFPGSVAYNKASVYQDRNKQDLITNLEKEVLGYRNTMKFINNLDDFESFLPENTKKFYRIYRKQFK